jgi:hypothetical protein
MESFLKIVFILILVYYAFKLTATYVFPWLLGRFVKKQQEKFFGQNQPYGDKTKSDVKNETNGKTKKSITKDDSSFGEYVDFEEIKE